MVALLSVSSGQGTEYLETASLPDKLGKHLIEKVAKINVEGAAVFSVFHRALLSALPCSAYFSAVTYVNI